MRVKEISINKYKSVTQPLTIKDFSNLHILVGPNNAGKTNILDALNLFFEENLNQERFFDLKADIRIVLAHENKEEILECKGNELKQSLFSDKFIRISNSSSLYDSVPKQLELFEKNYPSEYSLFSQCLHGYFKDIEINQELFLADHAQRPMKRMGEGFKRLFVILFYLFYPRYDIILIDEPELHLHPSVIKKLLAILAQENLDNQVFLTTHHPAFIQADYLKNVWRVTRNENESTTVYGFPDTEIVLDRFIQEINDENSDMLFCDKVFLVEGVSDYIFMREMFKKFYLKEKDIKVVYTGGQGSIDVYSDFCEYFKIPYAVMLDRDALDSPSLKRVRKYPLMEKSLRNDEKIKILKEKEIFLLEKSLEEVYPLKYSSKETKPLTAIHVSRRITRKDLESKTMKIIKEILEKI
jgi:predicted ATP-dependent endonuclease of OLD family